MDPDRLLAEIHELRANSARASELAEELGIGERATGWFELAGDHLAALERKFAELDKWIVSGGPLPVVWSSAKGTP